MGGAALGRLESVDLREVWPREADDFTPWLAQEDSLALLGDTIGIELDLEAQGKNVGPCRADILCRDKCAGRVLIENQLERTDHTHLGQILTYAAGLNAVTIVWIAYQFTEQHRAAVDWLNEISAEGFNFFGLEVELWRIGGSPPAPRFKLVCKPNDWTKMVREQAQRDAELTEDQQMQLEYWTKLRDVLQNHNVTSPKPSPYSYMNFSIGRSGFAINAIARRKDKSIGVRLVLLDSNAKAYFHLLENQKDEIERELKTTLEWQEKPSGKESHIVLRRSQADPTVRDQWIEQHQWLCEKVKAFDRVFRSRVKKLNADDYEIEEDDAS